MGIWKRLLRSTRIVKTRRDLLLASYELGSGIGHAEKRYSSSSQRLATRQKAASRRAGKRTHHKKVI